MDRYGISRETVRTYLSDEGGGFGLGPDALSAFTAYAPDMLHPLPDPAGEQMFADGNGGFARMIVKALLPDAIAGPNTLEGVTRGAVTLRRARSRRLAGAHQVELNRGLGAARRIGGRNPTR